MYQNVDRHNIHDTAFHLLALETISYIANKNLDSKQKFNEIEELGSHLGERIANHLLNNFTASSNTKMELEDIMKFLGRDVWLYLFGKQISKLQTNRKGVFLIDCDDIKFHHNLIMEKNKHDEMLDYILSCVGGIVKGVLGAFNIECSVSPNFKAQPIVSTILYMAGDNKTTMNDSAMGPFSYSFNITLLNLNF